MCSYNDFMISAEALRARHVRLVREHVSQTFKDSLTSSIKEGIERLRKRRKSSTNDNPVTDEFRLFTFQPEDPLPGASRPDTAEAVQGEAFGIMEQYGFDRNISYPWEGRNVDSNGEVATADGEKLQILHFPSQTEQGLVFSRQRWTRANGQVRRVIWYVTSHLSHPQAAQSTQE